MRRFTKEHNDLNWLYPNPHITEMKGESPEKTFDDYDKLGNFYLSECYGKQQNFTQDDMIDAFMKGTSTAYRDLVCDFRYHMRAYKFFEEYKDHLVYIQKLLDHINELEHENAQLRK